MKSSALLGLTLAAISVAGIVPAKALLVVSTTEVFEFTGKCADCTGTLPNGDVGAVLDLTGYTLGQTVDASNFVSFIYDGSNVFPGGFTVDLSELTGIGGMFPTSLPGPANIALSFDFGPFAFAWFDDGSWRVGEVAPAAKDYGYSSSYSAVPELSTWAMMALGFAGLGFTGYRTRADRRAVSVA